MGLGKTSRLWLLPALCCAAAPPVCWWWLLWDFMTIGAARPGDAAQPRIAELGRLPQEPPMVVVCWWWMRPISPRTFRPSAPRRCCVWRGIHACGGLVVDGHPLKKRPACATPAFINGHWPSLPVIGRPTKPCFAMAIGAKAVHAWCGTAKGRVVLMSSSVCCGRSSCIAANAIAWICLRSCAASTRWCSSPRHNSVRSACSSVWSLSQAGGSWFGAIGRGALALLTRCGNWGVPQVGCPAAVAGSAASFW